MARYVSFRDFDWILLAFVLIICGMGVMEIHKRYSQPASQRRKPSP